MRVNCGCCWLQRHCGPCHPEQTRSNADVPLMGSWQYCIPATCLSLLLFGCLRHCFANGFAYGSS
jgi:hypothetical protein